MSADAPLVLLVDDEPDVCTSLAALLRIEGFRVATAAHGAAALELLEHTRPDLVLADFMMPWMNGRELVLRLKADPATRHIPAIVMSGINPGTPEPWDAFLRKPADLDELRQVMRRLLVE